jgi:thiol:disulfide interchange protein
VPITINAWRLTIAAAILVGCASPPSQVAQRGHIYDSEAEGEQQLAAALTQARKEGKRVLLNLGADWCSDSQAMHRLLTGDPRFSDELRRHFVMVLVDVNQRGSANRNPHLVARLGNPLTRGIPVLLVLSPDGTVLNSDPAERLSDDAHTDPERVLRYLAKWRRH